MNILIKKYIENFIKPKISIGGKWNVSLVYPNGNEYFPFGENFKNNLILDQGLDILAESKYFYTYNGLNYNTIPAFLSSTAVLGDGVGELLPSNTSLSNQKQESTLIRPGSCSIVDNYTNGSRTFKKVYDFPAPNELISVREIGLNTPFAGKKLFSRFILPEPIKILPQIFIRLYYDFTVLQDAIINPINVTASSGSIIADGEIKLCGTFNNIFLTMDSNGNPTIGDGDSPRTSILPYYELYCTDIACSTQCFGTCFMMEPDSKFSSVNTSLSNEWVGQRLEDALGTISASTYVSGNFYRDITYTFNNDNPTNTENFGGFLFTVTKSNRQNTWDGWLWKFNNNQIKYNTKQLVIVLRQSISRI